MFVRFLKLSFISLKILNLCSDFGVKNSLITREFPGILDEAARSSCSGSLCAAALAAGVIADSLRSNSKYVLIVDFPSFVTITSNLTSIFNNHHSETFCQTSFIQFYNEVIGCHGYHQDNINCHYRQRNGYCHDQSFKLQRPESLKHVLRHHLTYTASERIWRYKSRCW